MEEYTKEQLELRQLAGECMDESLQKLLEGKIEESETMAARARDIYKEIQDKAHLAEALNRLSVIYDEMGNESMDLECLLDALEIVIDGEDYCLQAKLYNNLGSKFMYAKAYDRALECFKLASDSFQTGCKKDESKVEDNHSFMLVLNLNFTVIYYFQGDLEHSRRHYLLAKEEVKYNVDPDLIFVFNCFEGLTLWRLGEKEKSRAMIPSIVEMAKETEYTTDYLEVMSDLLELLKDMEDFENWEKVLSIMEEHLSDGISISVKLEILKQWMDFYQASSQMDRYKEACVQFYVLSLEKREEDLQKTAESIDLQLEMRRAAKQKKHTDSIVYLDPLTEIGNRNRMLEDSKKYIAESIKTVTPITIGLIDIDFFKECNDTYGHIVGDKCLKKVAEIIKEAVGKLGNVYRYGGDEFLLLLPKIEGEPVEEIGKKIKEMMEAEAIPNVKSAVSPYVTVSQGYTSACAEEGDNIDTLVNLADRVLYSVKRRGRNDYKFADIDEVLA